MIGLTKTAALEYAAKGVRINAVCPAVVETAMADRTFFHDKNITERTVAMHPMGRVGRPEEVASTVLWLCSKGAPFLLAILMQWMADFDIIAIIEDRESR